MYIRFLLSLILILIFKIGCYAQIILEPSNLVQRAKIGLVDEFIKRFNGQELHPNISFKDSTYRKDNLLYLFNASVEKKDSVLNEILSFINVVQKDSTELNYSDSNWFALAKCKGTLSGKTVTFDLYLSVQYRYDDMYKWVIAKADGNCFNIVPRDSSERIMLSPDSHETKFISLRRMTREQPFNVSLFMTDGFEYDQTSAFVFGVKTGQLKIDYVENLEFVFTQVPGYIFHIKYFERESNNSGWLIDKFYRVDNKVKNDLLNSLHIKYVFDDKVISLDDKTSNKSFCANPIYKPINQRMKEKVMLACDYLNYIQTSDGKKTKNFYKNKFRNLFSKTANVYFSNINPSSSLDSVTIGYFCDKILKGDFKEIYKVDSICIPELDEFVELKDSISLTSALQKTSQHILSLQDSNNALLIVEETEDGIEISTYLGDLYISNK